MAASQQPFYIVIGVVVVAGVAVIATRMHRTPTISIPANVVVTATDTSGFHGYLLGAATAPVEITEFADYQCPHCADFAQVQFPDLKTRLIDAGKARWRFRDFPIEGAGSRVAAHAAACANDQGKFWPVEESMFRRQTDWAAPYHQDPMVGLTQVIKDDGLDVDSWTACMKSAKYAGRIQASFNEGNLLGVNSTPSFLVAGRIYSNTSSDELVKLVDSLIAAAPPAKGAPPASSGGR